MAAGVTMWPCVRAMGVLYTYAMRSHHLIGLWECVARVPRSSIFLLVHYCFSEARAYGPILPPG